MVILNKRRKWIIVLIYLTFVLSTVNVFSQKKIIQNDDLDGNWQGSASGFENTIVTDDGKYIIYFVFSTKGNGNMIIQKLDGSWKKLVKGVRAAKLICKQQNLIYQLADTLVTYNLNKHTASTTVGVRSHRTSNITDPTHVAYQLKNGNVVISDLESGRKKEFKNVEDYQFDPNNSFLALVIKGDISKYSSVLSLVELKDFSEKVVHQGSGKVNNLFFDNHRKQLGFVKDNGNDNEHNYQLMYFKNGMENSICVLDSNTHGYDLPQKISSNFSDLKFSEDGSLILFRLAYPIPKAAQKVITKSVKVDVWHYNDASLQSQQQQDHYWPEPMASLNILERKFIRIQMPDEINYFFKISDHGFAIVRNGVNMNEKYWNVLDRPTFTIVSLKDGTRKTILKQDSLVVDNDLSFSPSGKYVIWANRKAERYYVYNIQTGKTSDISSYNSKLFAPSQFNDYGAPFGIAGWSENDDFVYIYDEFDIWQIDIRGIKPAVVITNGFGRANQLKLRYVDLRSRIGQVPIFHDGEEMLLSVFSPKTFQEGFCKYKYLGKSADPFGLTLSKYRTKFITSAKDARLYLVRRENASEAPNLFKTKDFKIFETISDIHPEREYNWLTAEMVYWKCFDGQEAMGILYKPENFDPNKKYPVIVNYYQYSGYPSVFSYPKTSDGEINIPYYVSNGYIVFRPEMKFTTGRPGYSAYNSIVSGVKYLSQFPWLDVTKMGLSGVSYGGYETNYLVTQTNIFAAAAPAAGSTDLVSDYNSLWSYESKQFIYERSQGRIGATLWEKPELYIENSPIFQAPKVTTPILILHNKNDDAVPWQQGLEWFTALRRLGKRAWMLQYDGQEHGVQGEASMDYSIRLAQFFDHYLKGKPAPIWMTKGIAAKDKGIVSGLEIDSHGSCGNNCPVCLSQKK